MKTKILMICAVIFFAMACGDDDTSKPPTNEDLIDTSGGTVESTNGDVVIDIPAGALTTATEITIVSTTSHPVGSIGIVYDLGPDGTKFNSPVSLTFTYEAGDIPSGFSEDDLVMAFAENGQWVPLTGSMVNKTENTVTASTDHFTPFAIVIFAEEEDPPSGLQYTPATYTFIPEQDVSTSTPNVSGTGPFEFSIAAIEPQSAVESFAINETNGVVTASGTSAFSTGESQVVLDVMVSNDAGSFLLEDALTFDLIYSPTNLQYDPANFTLEAGDALSSSISVIGGSSPFIYTLDNLPQGLGSTVLNIDATTGAISGTLSNDVSPGEYNVAVTVSNDAGSFTKNDALVITVEDNSVTMLPEDISYDVATYFTYTGNPTSAQIDILSGSDESFTYSISSLPSVVSDLTIDNMGNIVIGENFLLANGNGYYTLDVTLDNGEESKTYEEVVTIRAFNPQGYILEYNPRFSQVSAFNPEVTTATTNALFEPPNAPTFTIEKVYDQEGQDRTSELTSLNILTIASDGDLTFSDPGRQVISDNFYYFYVDVRINGASGNVVYRSVAVFGPE